MWPAKFFWLIVEALVFAGAGIRVPGLGAGWLPLPACNDPNKRYSFVINFRSPWKTLPASCRCMLMRNTNAVATKNILRNFIILIAILLGNWKVPCNASKKIYTGLYIIRDIWGVFKTNWLSEERHAGYEGIYIGLWTRVAYIIICTT